MPDYKLHRAAARQRQRAAKRAREAEAEELKVQEQIALADEAAATGMLQRLARLPVAQRVPGRL